MRGPRLTRPLLALALAAALAGCGAKKSGPVFGVKGSQSQAATQLGFPGFATKNTTRVGGADPVADAAAVARAVYPGLTPQTRPQAVVLADTHDWVTALAAAELMSPPLRAPLLFSQGGELPSASADALRELAPTGAPTLGGAQVLRIGGAAIPSGFRVRSIAGANPYATAALVGQLVSAARATPDRAVLVASSGAPAYAMPAAGYAAEAGVPLLFVTSSGMPPETRAALARLQSPRIYVVGPGSVVGAPIINELKKLGSVRRIRGANPADPVTNSIGFARFNDGSFGWHVVQPGHGLVFLNATRPLDAAAAAALSASGDYGPQLLLDSANRLSPPLESYLLDIQPGYQPNTPGHGPVDEFYNRGWLIGDPGAISLGTQARIDGLLEISPIPSNVTPTGP